MEFIYHRCDACYDLLLCHLRFLLDDDGRGFSRSNKLIFDVFEALVDSLQLGLHERCHLVLVLEQLPRRRVIYLLLQMKQCHIQFVTLAAGYHCRLRDHCGGVRCRRLRHVRCSLLRFYWCDFRSWGEFHIAKVHWRLETMGLKDHSIEFKFP
jgi:hypothetical protein